MFSSLSLTPASFAVSFLGCRVNVIAMNYCLQQHPLPPEVTSLVDCLSSWNKVAWKITYYVQKRLICIDIYASQSFKENKCTVKKMRAPHMGSAYGRWSGQNTGEGAPSPPVWNVPYGCSHSTRPYLMKMYYVPRPSMRLFPVPFSRVLMANTSYGYLDFLDGGGPAKGTYWSTVEGLWVPGHWGLLWFGIPWATIMPDRPLQEQDSRHLFLDSCLLLSQPWW